MSTESEPAKPKPVEPEFRDMESAAHEPQPSASGTGPATSRPVKSRRAHARATGGMPAPGPGSSPAGAATSGSAVLRAKASDDDPRAWGDRPDDLESWYLEQRPPHWG